MRMRSWPIDRQDLSEQEMIGVLEKITLLMRMADRSLRVICSVNIDVYETDILNRAKVETEIFGRRNLNLRFAYPGVVPTCGRWAGDFRVTIEDIFGNISVEDLKPGTFIEVQTRFVKIDHDDRLGQVWKPIFIIYDECL